MLRCGLLGETLGHSYSPMIHHELGEYDYRLFEVSKEDLDAFLCSDRWDGLNVTIPYKRDVMPLCDEIDPAAEAIGSVNTIVRCADGKLVGYNTDIYGPPGGYLPVREKSRDFGQRRGVSDGPDRRPAGGSGGGRGGIPFRSGQL